MLFANQRASTHGHGRPQEGGGHLPTTLMEFEKDDVICFPPVKYPKIFARAFGAYNKNPYT